ncbi:MAG: ribose-phosphate pyrophosphokinase [Myxococcaceae bacterium]|nr:MAG: ribose-phosphate pyrophosphokinase [Myxococcaceae bacterium]
MRKTVVCGPEMGQMGSALARELGEPVCQATVERFPDGELHVVLPERVAGHEVILVQSLTSPAGERLIELSLLADACRRARASSLTLLLPYFAYARQDRRTRDGEALGGEVLAGLVSTGGFDRIVAVDLHSDAALGWFRAPLQHLSVVTDLAESVRASLPPASVVVSPDLGGAKRAERVARLLERPLAIVHKTRGERGVVVHRILGDVRGRAVLIVDDIISTGGTIEAATRALRQAQCEPSFTVLATHSLLVGDAVDRLRGAGIGCLIHSDSVPPREVPFPEIAVPLAPIVASAIRRDAF